MRHGKKHDPEQRTIGQNAEDSWTVKECLFRVVKVTSQTMSILL